MYVLTRRSHNVKAEKLSGSQIRVDDLKHKGREMSLGEIKAKGIINSFP